MERLTEYHNGVAVIKDKSLLKQAMQKLAKYEDAEEQRLLFTFPCKVGDPAYYIIEETVPKHFYYISEQKVGDVTTTGIWLEGGDFELWKNVGKTVFLVKEEAETKLKEMVSLREVK